MTVKELKELLSEYDDDLEVKTDTGDKITGAHLCEGNKIEGDTLEDDWWEDDSVTLETDF